MKLPVRSQRNIYLLTVTFTWYSSVLSRHFLCDVFLDSNKINMFILNIQKDCQQGIRSRCLQGKFHLYHLSPSAPPWPPRPSPFPTWPFYVHCDVSLRRKYVMLSSRRDDTVAEALKLLLRLCSSIFFFFPLTILSCHKTFEFPL